MLHWTTKLNTELRILKIENINLKEHLHCANSELSSMRTNNERMYGCICYNNFSHFVNYYTSFLI
jgi:hypothetical protein